MSNTTPAADFVCDLPSKENGLWTADIVWDVLEAVAAQPGILTRENIRAYRGTAGVYALQAMTAGVSDRSNRIRFNRAPLVSVDSDGYLTLTPAGAEVVKAI